MNGISASSQLTVSAIDIHDLPQDTGRVVIPRPRESPADPGLEPSVGVDGKRVEPIAVLPRVGETPPDVDGIFFLSC